MNFLLTVFAAFLTYYHQVHHCHAIEFDLDAFMKNFEKSQADLKWIREESHKNEGKEIESAHSKENNFDEDDESSVDHWYNKYRKWECSAQHGDKDSRVLNGYCGIYDDSQPEHEKFTASNNLKQSTASDYRLESNLKDSNDNFDFTDTDTLSEKVDNLDVPEHFDLDSDTKLTPEEKLDLEEYNEQMIPNPNFYKIHNELHANDQQINKDHDSIRNELGFSPTFSKYPSSVDDAYPHIENDYGNGNEINVQSQDIKMKRNTQDFDDASKTDFSHFSYGQDDQDDTRKNDLSHEANYKLSKSEQESQNKQEPSIEQESPLKHGSEIEQRVQNEPKNKFGSELRNGNRPQYENPEKTKTGETPTHSNNFKEINKLVSNEISHTISSDSKMKFSPRKPLLNSNLSKRRKSDQLANEINLKISNRMMSKGLGASLPSHSVKYNPSKYRHPMNIDVENQRWGDRRNENRNDFTDYIGKQRRLLQFDYEDPGNDNPLHENSNAPNEMTLLKNGFIQTLNNQKLAKNNDIPMKPLVTTNSSERRNLKELGTVPVNSTTETPDHVNIGLLTKTNQSESNYTLQTNHVDSIKLQLELNISNATAKEQPADEHGKIVKRSATYDKQFGLQETKIQGISKNSSIRDLVSGKLPNQLIQTVFQLVKENSRLNEAIGSKLDMKILDNLQLNSINLLKSKDKTERMVKKLMSSITNLIDDQITHQTCISLPADLQSFYDKVIYVRTINAKVNNKRKQNKGNADVNKNSTKRIARNAIPETDLHQKYKTVGKLLKQFGHLKLRDQVKIFDIKEFLQNHMQLLDDLKTFNSEFVRESRSVENKNKIRDSQDMKPTELEEGTSHISRQYANLLKTTKLIKSTALTDMNRMDVISTY